MAKATEVAPGAVLHDRYLLEQVVGTGGMATVWLARDERLQRPVAVKVMADTLAADDVYVRRFEREARTAAGLSHPNLVNVFDFSAEGERPFLVMEYVPGGNLVERMRSREPMPDAGALARDMLGALAHVHAAGIVHRDIKPANVLIDESGRGRLTDFGIAQPEDATHLTRTGQLVGTLKYLAPEVTAGEPATARSDLYSCGILLRECVPDGAPALGRLTSRLTASDPLERPDSAVAALALLDETADTAQMDETAATAVMGERGGGADRTAVTAPLKSPTRPAATPRRGSRRRALAALVAAALLAAGAVAIVSYRGGGSDQPARSTPSPAPAGAPLDQQLDALERIVRESPR
jgi:eukaryotic-like serine/threonine-protein kinase